MPWWQVIPHKVIGTIESFQIARKTLRVIQGLIHVGGRKLHCFIGSIKQFAL